MLEAITNTSPSLTKDTFANAPAPLKTTLCFKPMIDKLRSLSQSIQFLRYPAIGVGIFCLVSAIYIVFTSRTTEGDFYLVPSILGFLWSISTLSLLMTFHSVPEKADASFSFFRKVTRSLKRGWFWILSLAFFATSTGVIVTTYRIVSIWFKEYGA